MIKYRVTIETDTGEVKIGTYKDNAECIEKLCQNILSLGRMGTKGNIKVKMVEE